MNGTTTIPSANSKPLVVSPYSEEELKKALDSLLQGSEDPSVDARHWFGHDDPNHKLSMLQTITATRILDYERYCSSGAAPSIENLLQAAQEFSNQHGTRLNLQTVIQQQSPRMALAAEFKRASPSKGLMASSSQLQAGEQAVRYTRAGANIISVLTEERWFQGTLQDLTQVRVETSKAAASEARPAVLRKDFVINRYMIAEAASAGADTVLLIVAVLPQYLLQDLIQYARTLDMEPLVEVHADEELEVALQAGARVIGVNNRNLHTFQMDLATSERVAETLTQKGLVFQHTSTATDEQSQQHPQTLPE
jgi:indole-3-glycerol phosphate synthase